VLSNSDPEQHPQEHGKEVSTTLACELVFSIIELNRLCQDHPSLLFNGYLQFGVQKREAKFNNFLLDFC
jgi:hypothetical protein